MIIFGIPVFTDVSTIDIGLLVGLYFLSFAVKGMFGLGAMPPLVIFGAWILEPHHAVVLAVISNVFSQLQFIPEGVRNGDWRSVRGLILAYLPATVLGVWIFGWLETAWLTVVLGATLIAVILAEAFSVFKRHEETIQRRASVLGPILAAVSGVLAGVAGAGGVIMVSTYIKFIVKDPQKFRATIILIATFFIGWRTIVFAANGFVTLGIFAECLILLPISLIGGYVGSLLFGIIPKERFFPAFRIALLLASLNLVVKGAMSAFGG
ncbi:MAG: sulfite exporter TauE/SafE family protein [Alphaproteobacteria bacterium]|nr:sulfite exporter TauE/SafE family protein [Alphaproteobacteria bacterium]